jgi:predicted nucleic acid-binding protein
LIYVDTSALMKLLKDDEVHAKAMSEHIQATESPIISSALLAVELRRAMLRIRPADVAKADLLLSRVRLLDMSQAIVESASQLPDPMLRSLDAIHLATALLIREDLDAVLTYDDRLATAAASHGLTVESPGLTP